ncbi:hypothetical protein [Actinomadura vinacea]|uniref:hypothetical protein n=1 Tax=Actinomadura vinacea TaxID=115336 RepID=UPI0031E0C0B7
MAAVVAGVGLLFAGVGGGDDDRPGARGSRPPSRRRSPRGPGHFTEYCKSLGWEWVAYRETPQPGAYCVRRADDTMLLTAAQRNAGCRWRYGVPEARHYFKDKSNYCYTTR